MRSMAWATLFGILTVLQTSQAFAQTAPLLPGTRIITVGGHGEVEMKLDLITISFSMDSSAPTGEQCTKLQTEKVRKVIDALKAMADQKMKIETSDYSLNSHDEPDNAVTAPLEEGSPTGWTFKATITAGSDNIVSLGAVLDAGLAAGATDVAGSGFQLFPVENPITPSAKKAQTHNAYTPSVTVATDQSEQPATRQLASVSVDVEARGATANDAVRQGVQLDDKVVTAFRSKIGQHGALRLDNFTILKNPPSQVQPMNSFRQVPQRKVYVAQTTVTATTGKLDSLGALVEAGMKAGASQLNSVSFTLSDPTAAGNAAIAAAAKNAEGKAATLAVSMNVKLGKILNISNSVQVQPRMVYGGYLQQAMVGRQMKSESAEAAIMPVLPRELGVVADVTVIYEIQ